MTKRDENTPADAPKAGLRPSCKPGQSGNTEGKPNGAYAPDSCCPEASNAQDERSAHSPKTKNEPAKRNEPTTVVANNLENGESLLKLVGGSRCNDWNITLANQALQSLWVNNSDAATRDKQTGAALAALMSIGPKDELEGMMVAQLIAAHSATMECYRRAMIGDQTFEGRRENLNQANKLSRTWVTLLDAINKYRGKGQQKVTVEHVHVHAGGQAVVGAVETKGGRGPQ